MSLHKTKKRQTKRDREGGKERGIDNKEEVRSKDERKSTYDPNAWRKGSPAINHPPTHTEKK